MSATLQEMDQETGRTSGRELVRSFRAWEGLQAKVQSLRAESDPAKDYGAIMDPDELDEVVSGMLDVLDNDSDASFGFDIETGYEGPDAEGVSVLAHHPASKVVGFSFTSDPSWARYVPVSHDGPEMLGGVVNLDPTRAAQALWRLLRTGRGVAHNAGFELAHLSRWFREVLTEDAEFGDEVRAARGHFPVRSDTLIELYCLAEIPAFGLKAAVQSLYQHTMTSFHELFPALGVENGKRVKRARFNTLDPAERQVIEYACEDAAWCLAIHRDSYPRIKDRMIYQTEMSVLGVVVGMSDHGIKYDWPEMARAAAQVREFLPVLEAEIMAELSEMVGAPVSINLASSQQVGKILYDRLGFAVAKRSKVTGAPSVDAIALVALAKRYPVVAKITWWKELTKLLGTFLEKYPVTYSYAADGHSHPNYLQALVPSGRFAVSDPPFQQSPRNYAYALESGAKFKLNFRDFIIAPEEHYILGYDYSQIELRVLAGVSGEPALVRAFDAGDDVHRLTASLMLGVPLDEVTKDQRSKGKTLGFALLYGLGIKGLADRLGVPKDEAQDLYDRFFAVYSSVGAWVAATTAAGIRDGYVTTRFGRRVTIWELASDQSWVRAKGERLCVNAPIQGGAADYMKVAMVRAHRALERAGLLDRVHLVMNIHDALEFYVHQSLTPQEVIDVLAPAVTYAVPGWPKIVADWHVGLKWGSLTELEIGDDGVVRRKGEDRPSAPATETGQEEPQDHAQEALDSLPEPVQEPDVPQEPPAAPGPSELPGESSVALSGPPRPIVVEVVAMPTTERWTRFLALVASRPGPNPVTLATPQGEVELSGVSTGLTPEHGAEVSLVLGGARVRYVPGAVDFAAVGAGLEL